MSDPLWFPIPTQSSQYNTVKLGMVPSEADAGPVAILIGERESGMQDMLFIPVCTESAQALRAFADAIAQQVGDSHE